MSRRNPRRTHVDYRHGWFLVTFVTAKRRHRLGSVHDGVVTHSPIGHIVADELRQLADLDGVVLDAWVVMPNHVHALLHVQDVALGAVIGRCKARSTRRCRSFDLWSPDAPLWHRGYHDRGVRTLASMQRVRAYIAANPRQWRRS